MRNCRPYVCDYPDPRDYRWASRWTCPKCGWTYVRTHAVKDRPWKTYSAAFGTWRIALFGGRP